MIDVPAPWTVAGTPASRSSAAATALNIGVHSLLAVDLTRLIALVEAVDRRGDSSIRHAARAAWQVLEGQSWPWLALLSACVLALHMWEASLPPPAPVRAEDAFEDNGTWW